MSKRTYLPTLQRIAKRLCVYITRNRDTLAANMTPTQVLLLDALVEACMALDAALVIAGGV